MSTSLIFVLSLLLSLIHLIAGFLFPTAAPAPAPSSCCPSPPPPPPPMCCQPAPPPPPPTCCSSPAPTCGGGCGGRRRYRSKREADLMPPGIRDEEKEECHNPMLREAIEESITFQLASSIRKLNFRLQKSDFASNRYIAICMLTEEPYKFFCPTQKFCTHGNEQITCHVFEG
ncbi:hypothetical protein L596_015697 [Steinernema carpocapsae]|uniref:Ground-like domain-containing protein n=1 Tax=Steinernema carpocapsae TaxID=34508 RepID=A0A4U5NFX1_STECR|nr:hypothetical protein L596_015697 [Steinernema carpocapsae]